MLTLNFDEEFVAPLQEVLTLPVTGRHRGMFNLTAKCLNSEQDGGSNLFLEVCCDDHYLTF